MNNDTTILILIIELKRENEALKTRVAELTAKLESAN